ncbi:MAG: transporter [Candidatus Saccharibacteria bacterium]|nr:transporter [Moraxellaceae bacterium]
MRFSRSLLAASVGVIFAAGTTQVMAQGFTLYSPDISTMGNAYAGAAATAENASVVATNPAAMSRLDGVNVTLNNTLILAKTDIKNPVGSTPGTNKGDMVPRILVGSAFITFPHVLLDNLSMGIGLYAPFGLKTNYESTFQGRAFGDKSTVTVATLQPTISYAFTPSFSAGAGLTVNHFNGVLTSGVSPAIPKATQELSGARNAFGYNVGFLFSPITDMNIGLTYHSEVEYDLRGNTEVLNTPISGTPYTFNAKGRGNLVITTPDSLELAATYKIVPTVELKAGITRTRWSTISTLAPKSTFTASGVTTSVPLPAVYKNVIAGTLNAGSSSEVVNFEDVNMYSLGATWQVQSNLALRAGVAYDESPANKKDRNVRIPTADRAIYAVGANYALSKNTSVDLAYNYLSESNAHISRADPSKGIYQADFENTGHLIAAQLNHKF